MQISNEQAKILANAIKSEIKSYVDSHQEEFAKFLAEKRGVANDYKSN